MWSGHESELFKDVPGRGRLGGEDWVGKTGRGKRAGKTECFPQKIPPRFARGGMRKESQIVCSVYSGFFRSWIHSAWNGPSPGLSSRWKVWAPK